MKDDDLKLMLTMIKDQRDMIEAVYVQAKQEAMAVAGDAPNDGNEALAADEERLDVIHVKDVATVIEKLGEKTGIEFEDFYDYF